MVGLRALQADLCRMGADMGPLNRQLVEAGRTAAEPVAALARSAVPHVTGTLAGTVRLGRSRTGATVRMGSTQVLYAGPADFGGYPGDWPYKPQGRYLFPAGQQLHTTAVNLYAEAIQRVVDTFDWANVTADPAAVHD
jgi:hypothetical protein